MHGSKIERIVTTRGLDKHICIKNEYEVTHYY